MKSHHPGCMSDEECTCQDYDDEQATESDTPETDAEIALAEPVSDDLYVTAWVEKDGVDIEVVDAEFARRLERERNKAIEQIKIHNAIMREACEKMDELRRERDEARRLAEKYRNVSCDTQEDCDNEPLPWEKPM